MRRMLGPAPACKCGCLTATYRTKKSTWAMYAKGHRSEQIARANPSSECRCGCGAVTSPGKVWLKGHHFRKHSLRMTDFDSVQAKRNERLSRVYGVSVQCYQKMLDKQGGGCAICGNVSPGRGKGGAPLLMFCVDHDHNTDVIRGLLCRACNAAIGLLGDDPQRIRVAAEYLEKCK